MSDQEEENAVLAFDESLVPVRERKLPGITSLTFDKLLNEPLLLKEDLKSGCGGQLWPAGMLLAEYLLREQRESLRGKTIVELGAGGGLVGLAVARGCPPLDNEDQSLIYITDLPAMFPLMKENIALNKDLAPRVQPVVLDWAHPPPEEIPQHPAVLLAADCVYFEPAFPLLIETMERLIGPDTVCYFCYKRRRRADLRCIKQIKKKFSVEDLQGFVDASAYARENLFLYRITKQK